MTGNPNSGITVWLLVGIVFVVLLTATATLKKDDVDFWAGYYLDLPRPQASTP